MRGLLAPLSRYEEVALRKIGFGSDDPLDPSHVRRLLGLQLIEWDRDAWRLTAVGRQRYGALVLDTQRPFDLPPRWPTAERLSPAATLDDARVDVED